MRSIDARRLTPEKRLKILERDNNLCVYCFAEADEVDHLVPWSHEHNDSDENLVASCFLCNRIASNKMFEDFKSKREHILKRREQFFKKNIIPIWTVAELKQLGYALRKRVESAAVVVEDHKTQRECADKLMRLGFRVAANER